MLAIIGGTGVYNIENIEILGQEAVDTPYGKPSSDIVKGKYGENEFLFLARHGNNHALMPHEVNYRANIWALKHSGATRIIGVSAVGSLREEIAPGDFAIPSGYFDFIKGNREKTFFGNGLVGHVSTANPTCSILTNHIANIASKSSYKIHTNNISYACVDGPRLGTKTESNFLRNSANCDLVGMTNVPEVFLAREAAICYCTIGVVTDYDCWRDNPDEYVNVADVIARYQGSIVNVKDLLKKIFEAKLPERSCGCKDAVKQSILTPEDVLSDAKKDLLKLLTK
jgi:5'-methylthioadenosine phosphorylase